ncbi:hypothetical protein [Natronobacterium gregoryi]|uniref:CbaC protein n=2 Tax=Natronobacterium gregoryi TaxID=44930 RepID=L0AD07_NATGS|nr:hypothetical protein [Natronobacterium gregoryi]AFZ71314.1 hypothetical protein Natgr_0044 [Natronobacterium gregoryi SP2]ELY67203.1 hypothetical protein C490_11386 [Natronobacterium gregoryi SP2]PLK19184.1 CbaC protein [Natronobacterium gregoryi SP2]SFJ58949.1 hypothetical protein SAMN05443661_14317 [Natronobacterium gregoryi]
MRLSRARLLILIGLWLVILVELRTVFAFFDIYISVGETVAIGVVVLVLLVLWAVWPADDAE